MRDKEKLLQLVEISQAMRDRDLALLSVATQRQSVTRSLRENLALASAEEDQLLLNEPGYRRDFEASRRSWRAAYDRDLAQRELRESAYAEMLRQKALKTFGRALALERIAQDARAKG